MRELLRCTRDLISEWRLQPSDWCPVLPIIQLILNHSPSTTMRNVSPITAMIGLDAMRLKDRIAAQSEPLIASSLQDVLRRQCAHIELLSVALDKMHKLIAEANSKRRAQQRDVQSKKPNVKMANFDIGDSVLYADVWAHKLRMKWNAPAEVTATISNWLYEIRNTMLPDPSLMPRGIFLRWLHTIPRVMSWKNFGAWTSPCYGTL